MLKVRQRLFLWWDLFKEEAIAPLTDRTALLQFLTFPLYIYFLFQTKTCSAVVEEIMDTVSFAQAFIYAFPAYLIWCAIKSACCVREAEKELGEWVDNRFVFNSLRHIRTLVIHPDENGVIEVVVVPGRVPPNARVRFDVSYNDGHGYLILKHDRNDGIPNLGVNPRGVKQSVMLTKKSEIFIEKRIEENSDPTIAKLSMIYWEK